MEWTASGWKGKGSGLGARKGKGSGNTRTCQRRRKKGKGASMVVPRGSVIPSGRRRDVGGIIRNVDSTVDSTV
jgi:hypothetical protein